MKVAILLSGHMSNLKQCYENIYQNIILPNQADVFIHSWYDENHLQRDSIDRNRNLILQKDDHLHAIKLYQPKKYLFEKPKDFSKNYTHLHVPNSLILANKNGNKFETIEDAKKHIIRSSMSMFYGIYKCNELKEIYAEEQGITYDFVIRVRFDVQVSGIIDVNQLNKNYIYYIPLGQKDELVSDWVNVASNLIMNIYTSTFLKIEYLNTFMFLPKHQRKPITISPSNECMWGNEHFIRDVLDMHHISSRPLNLSARLVY
uniref:Uncharacterized protein n=1 Tax=viral metagenome TaxID=1070528 RepID=A0A6C0CRP7_9ZZZZ